MAKAITLKDVAREAGVHISTASRALNEETRSGLSAETADRVVAAAERLGYQPHPLARGLRTNRTRSARFFSEKQLHSGVVQRQVGGVQVKFKGIDRRIHVGSGLEQGVSPSFNGCHGPVQVDLF